MLAGRARARRRVDDERQRLVEEAVRNVLRRAAHRVQVRVKSALRGVARMDMACGKVGGHPRRRGDVVRRVVEAEPHYSVEHRLVRPPVGRGEREEVLQVLVGL